jgi:uncharacterized alkaline shock family protein YloU
MLSKIDNKQGSIIIENAVMGRVVVQASKKFKGRLWLANQKGKITRPRNTGYEDLRNIEIADSADGIDIKVYTVISFGTSISAISKDFINEIRDQNAKITGLPINQITIVLTGVRSKRISKREIEIVG